MVSLSLACSASPARPASSSEGLRRSPGEQQHPRHLAATRPAHRRRVRGGVGRRREQLAPAVPAGLGQAPGVQPVRSASRYLSTPARRDAPAVPFYSER